MDERSEKLRELVSQWLEREDTILLAKHKLVLKLYYVERTPDHEIARLLEIHLEQVANLRSKAIAGLCGHREFKAAYEEIMLGPDAEK